MNRVYKVIWSKAKHCYVVTSEIARSVTKSASSARSAGRKGAAVLAMAALLFTAGGVLGEAANVTDVKPGSTADVIMVTKDDGTTTPITINDVYHAMKANSDGDGLIINENYVKNADARVSTDGEYVKKDKKVGENLSALDAQVKKNTDAVAAEETARKTADQNNLKVGDDGVISKVTGDDGTTSSAVNTLVLNKDGDNQITMDEKGIKVGKNSTVIASDGVFAGGDTATDAKAALNANGSIKGANGDFEVNTGGSIKGANGKFTVDTNGQVTANGGVDTNSGGILTRGGNINAGAGAIIGGAITGTSLNTQNGAIIGGAITGTTITATGKISTGGDVVSTGGKVQGTSVSDGTATLSGGSLTDAVNITASGTITGHDVVVNDKLTTKNLEVTDGLKTDHITLGSDGLNQTDINKGKVTSKIHEISGAVEYTAESIFNKDGSSITVRTNEGRVDSTGSSTVGSQIITQYLGNNAVPGGNNVTRKMIRNNDGTFSMEDKAVYDGKSSTVSQNAKEGIVSETNGGAGSKVTLTQGMNGTYKVETSGTSTEEISGQKIENYKGGLATEITGDETHDVSGTMTTTVEGKATENFNGGLATEITGDETHDVSGTMTTTVEGKATENFNGGLATEITGDETHDVSGTMTTTVEGKATENFNGGLATEITGDETHTATGIITNTAQTVKTITENNTVTSDKGGTTFKNEDAKTPFEEGDERGTKDNTKITGNKVETGKVLTDFAEVANNLDVKGSTTLGRDGNTTLTVNSESTFRDTVKMDKTLEVDGESTFNNKVTITKNGLDVTGGTTTDTLTVTGTSEFADRADFRKDVFMWEDLEVTGETRTDTLYVDHDGYVGGNLQVDGNIETHDAVLSADSRQVVTGRQLYQTNERVDRLDNRIKKVGANAAALAALRPGDFNPDDKFSIAAGFGSYRNANAAALGLFYRPNENVLLSLGTSFGDGENMVNAGVSVKFGRGKSMAERRKEMADEVSSMRDEMRSQDERIAELEEMLKKQSELIEKLSKES